MQTLAYITGAGWSNWDAKQDWLDGEPVKIKVGIDNNGYIGIYSLNNDGVTWKLHARTSYALPEGGEYRLGIKSANSTPRVATAAKVHLLPEVAPTMYFRYIESPDGVFQYPLFATTEEAEYYDEQAGGSGTYHSHVFADEPTNTTWYMPDTNAVHNGTSAPAIDLTLGQASNYTEITSLTNSALVPTAYSDYTITVDEGSTINVQTQPQDTAYTTTFSGLPLGVIGFAGNINGTAPEVTGDNVANPSDTYTVTVTRTNSYGSSQGTLTIVVNNLTAPVVTPITGVTVEGSVGLIDSDTMDDGSVISIDEQVGVGERFTIDKEWVDNYVLPKITSGTGAKAVFIGFPYASADLSTIGFGDFQAGWQFYSDDTTRSQNNWRLRTISGGSIISNVGIGGQTSGLYDYALINDGTDLNYGGLVASQGLDISTYVYNFSGVDSNWKYTGGITGVTSQSRDVVIGTLGTDMDIDLQYFGEYTEPTAPTSMTNFNKAIDFSGNSERAQKVNASSDSTPIKQDYGSTNTVGSNGSTSSYSSARPWATAIVFRIDGNNSNQHIWNQGEGAGSTDDNIYLRVDSAQNLYFGWGRSGAVNECRIATAISSGFWYGIYIGYDGRRWASGGATANNLANTFDIRMMSGHDNFGTLYDVGDYNQWNQSSSTTGARMDRTIGGEFTIGGRGSNRNFHGKVASMVVTTLKLNVTMPNDAEIEMMITDPMKWIEDYKKGNTYRRPNYNTNATDFQIGNTSAGWAPAFATQVWLMGDGSNDSYSNMIRNQVNAADQNYTKLNMISMVSNDIQNVTIGGLS